MYVYFPDGNAYCSSSQSFSSVLAWSYHQIVFIILLFPAWNIKIYILVRALMGQLNCGFKLMQEQFFFVLHSMQNNCNSE
jgi:hypothetical protein